MNGWLKRFSCFLVVILMVFLAACERGGSSTTSGENSGSNGSNIATSTNSSNMTATGSDKTSNVTSKTGSSSTGSVSPIKTEFSPSQFSLTNIPASVKAKEVHVLMWRDYTTTEHALVKAFTKQTGIKVRTTTVQETQYQAKLVSLISAKDSPDVVCLESAFFPSFIIKSMQKLDTNTFRLNDPIWDKTAMDCYKVNGGYYGVSIRGSWSCEDDNFCTYYNPSVLKNCGITTMPYQLYKQGKWNWDAQHDIAQKVSDHLKTGMMVQVPTVFMHSAGADIVTFNGKQMINNLGNVKSTDPLAKGWIELANLYHNDLLGNANPRFVNQGGVGLLTAVAVGLGKESGWFVDSGNLDDAKGLEAVPVAGPKGGTAYTPV